MTDFVSFEDTITAAEAGALADFLRELVDAMESESEIPLVLATKKFIDRVGNARRVYEITQWIALSRMKIAVQEEGMFDEHLERD